MLAEMLSTVCSGSVGDLQKHYNTPHFAGIVRELFCSAGFDAEMSEQTLGRWKSLLGLFQQTEDDRTIASSGRRDCSKFESGVTGCEGGLRSLGQIAQAPLHAGKDSASTSCRYV